MPTSKLELIQPIIHLIWQYRQGVGRPLRILDVGPGWGKYGLLIREAADPDAWIDAIEPHPVWDLSTIYRHVWEWDVRKISDHDPKWHPGGWPGWATYDLILLIDVIEHLHHTEGFALLASIPTTILISTPATLFATPAEAPELPEWEQHRSLWSPENIREAVYPRKATFIRNRHAQVVALIHPPG